MKDLQKQTTSEDIQFYIERAFDVINEHIPEDYVDKVFKLLPDKTNVTKAIIQNVRRKRQKPERRLEIFIALYQVCVNERILKEKFIQSLK